jgi:hypothetical protein
MTRFTAFLSSLALMFALSAFATAQKIDQTSPNNANPKTIRNNKVKGDVLAPAQSLSGTISMIGPSGKEVTVIGLDGVPYDFNLTNQTKIEMGKARIHANDLANETHKQATVHFLPTARGNLAETIQIS